MAERGETPNANRVHIAFFGLRNAGKSTLVNAFTGQNIAIVSDVAGTTTDPVSKAMEILPLGPCLITDTAGLDDVGKLGAERVRRTLDVLATTDVAVWVETGNAASSEKERFAAACRARAITLLTYRRGDSVDELKRQIAALKLSDAAPALLEGLIERSDHIIFVCPIDESAPKGRLILPQVQAIREALDRHAVCTVCQPTELKDVLVREDRPALVVTDSQAFRDVAAIWAELPGRERFRLTSFSVLFARQKGDLAAFLAGVDAIAALKEGDSVLIAEGCTHHRQCNDIGTVKIPKALAKLTGGKTLHLTFAAGNDFPALEDHRYALVVQCGGCMLTRRAVLKRIDAAKRAGVPIVNYGLLLAAAAGTLDAVKAVMRGKTEGA